jgi:hypothetical protein
VSNWELKADAVAKNVLHAFSLTCTTDAVEYYMITRNFEGTFLLFRNREIIFYVNISNLFAVQADKVMMW